MLRAIIPSRAIFISIKNKKGRFFKEYYKKDTWKSIIHLCVGIYIIRERTYLYLYTYSTLICIILWGICLMKDSNSQMKVITSLYAMFLWWGWHLPHSTKSSHAKPIVFNIRAMSDIFCVYTLKYMKCVS